MVKSLPVNPVPKAFRSTFPETTESKSQVRRGGFFSPSNLIISILGGIVVYLPISEE